MDVRVRRGTDGLFWEMTDLLGRSMGCIVEEATACFSIHPAGNALDTLAALTRSTYSSLDDALAAIEKHTRGVCRLES
jgi:hypothetical protein